MEGRFSYESLGGLVNIVTLSPSKQFYYQLQKPHTLNRANYGCCIAFFDIQGQLLYHRKRAKAHWLLPHDYVHFVKWSKNGQFALFHEYLKDYADDFVYLDLMWQKCYRINLFRFDPDVDFLNKLEDREYDGWAVLQKIKALGVKPSPMVTDPLPKRRCWDRLLGRKRWYPAI